MLAAIRAANQVLATLKETGTIAGVANEVPTFKEFFDLLGMPDVQALEASYGIDEGARVRY
jgi:2-methylisocitrate lyase-like PEP mutase family enzyme